MRHLDLIPQLLKIARSAGDAILDIYHSGADFGVGAKADHSPLTRADRAANDIICRGLEGLPVAFPIISEENKLLPWEVRRQWRLCWLVDPLDGTKEFIQRNGDFTVNIALVENGRAVLGIVLTPAHGELCWAVAGHGAFLIKNGVETRLRAATFRESDPGLNLVCSRSHLTPETEVFIARYDCPNLVSRGSALKFLLLAKGEAHVYPRIAPTMEWDTAAAQIVLEEAGGRVLVFETGEPLRYNREDLLNPAFVAFGKKEVRGVK
ncbi:MAG: 3'(2'),5'-bisphosphate nucleotidase CysQ [Bacteroidetes bacterium]|nr:3'(2'),5'-bisphosphate nucleotidase CysQ [Bacteroidota bacterium]